MDESNRWYEGGRRRGEDGEDGKRRRVEESRKRGW